MSPVTHFLASWTMADVLGLRGRDRNLVTWCGVLPDADGLGLLVDGVNGLLGRPDSWWYGENHHVVLHGLLGAIMIPAVLAWLAVDRLRMFLLGVVAVHLHLLCDLVGSRGPGTEDIWQIAYLSPFSHSWTIGWSGQWPLNAWPNIAFTLALIAFAFARAIQRGESPVGVFSRRADEAFVATVRTRWRSVAGS